MRKAEKDGYYYENELRLLFLDGLKKKKSDVPNWQKSFETCMSMAHWYRIRIGNEKYAQVVKNCEAELDTSDAITDRYLLKLFGGVMLQ